MKFFFVAALIAPFALSGSLRSQKRTLDGHEMFDMNATVPMMEETSMIEDIVTMVMDRIPETDLVDKDEVEKVVIMVVKEDDAPAMTPEEIADEIAGSIKKAAVAKVVSDTKDATQESLETLQDTLDSVQSQIEGAVSSILNFLATDAPTGSPTMSPTAAPTSSPTAAPTSTPTAAPTGSPTLPPTLVRMIADAVSDIVNEFLASRGLPTLSEATVLEIVKEILMKTDIDLSSLSAEGLANFAEGIAKDLMDSFSRK